MKMGTREKLFRQKLANQIESLLTKSEKVFTSEKLSNEWLDSMLEETQELNSALTIYKFLHELPENENLQVELLELKEKEEEEAPSEAPNYSDEILKEIDEFEAQEAIDVFETSEDKIEEPVLTEELPIEETFVESNLDSEKIEEEEEEKKSSSAPKVEADEIIANPIEEVDEVILEESISISEDSTKDITNEEPIKDDLPESDTKKEINDAMAINETSVADKLRSNSIQKLADSIALNERFLFSNELFNGNMEAFKRALTELDHIASIADAQRYIDVQLKTENQWNMESETVERFVSLVKRRFN